MFTPDQLKIIFAALQLLLDVEIGNGEDTSETEFVIQRVSAEQGRV